MVMVVVALPDEGMEHAMCWIHGTNQDFQLVDLCVKGQPNQA